MLCRRSTTKNYKIYLNLNRQMKCQLWLCYTSIGWVSSPIFQSRCTTPRSTLNPPRFIQYSISTSQDFPLLVRIWQKLELSNSKSISLAKVACTRSCSGSTPSICQMSLKNLNVKVWFDKMKLCFSNAKVDTYYSRKTFVTK